VSKKCDICGVEQGQWPDKLLKPHQFWRDERIQRVCKCCDRDLREGLTGIERLILRRGKDRTLELHGRWPSND